MLRISIIDDSDQRSLRLSVEGWLIGPWMDELRNQSERCLPPKPSRSTWENCCLWIRMEPPCCDLVFSGWYKTWFEHMIEHERRRMRLGGLSQPEISGRMRQYASFYDPNATLCMISPILTVTHEKLGPEREELPKA